MKLMERRKLRKMGELIDMNEKTFANENQDFAESLRASLHYLREEAADASFEQTAHMIDVAIMLVNDDVASL